MQCSGRPMFLAILGSLVDSWPSWVFYGLLAFRAILGPLAISGNLGSPALSFSGPSVMVLNDVGQNVIWIIGLPAGTALVEIGCANVTTPVIINQLLLLLTHTTLGLKGC